jgi:hypothetical protein
VHAGLAVPDHFLAPIRRRRQRIVLRRRRLGIAHRHFHGGGGVGLRIEHGEEVRALLGRAVELTVGVDSGLALVGRDLVMQIGLGAGPVPDRDDDVALDTLRPRGLRCRQLARGDAVGPVREHFKRARHVDTAHVVGHLHLRLPGHDAPHPGFLRLHVGKLFRDRARRLVAELMAGIAAVGLDHVEPLRLALHIGRHAVTLRPGARKLAFVRHFQHRVPIDRRVIFRRCGCVRRRYGGEVQNLSGRALHLR